MNTNPWGSDEIVRRRKLFDEPGEVEKKERTQRKEEKKVKRRVLIFV